MTAANPTTPDVLANFGAAVEDAARCHRGDERATVEAVAHLMRGALAQGINIPPSLRRPHPDHYVMYPAYVAEDSSVSVAAAVWNVGQRTPIHDHLTWGVIGIVSGCEREERYKVKRAGYSPPKLVEVRHHGPGAVTVCCTFEDDVHAVACEGDEPTLGLHIYGGDIGVLPRRTFDPETGRVDAFISRWHTAEMD